MLWAQHVTFLGNWTGEWKLFGCVCTARTRLPLRVNSCHATVHFHTIMESHANEYELKHLQFHPSLHCPFFFSSLLFLAETKFPPALGLLPWSTGWRAGGFICWEGHVSWWRLSLSFSGSSDTNLDASVLTASLRRCNMHPQRSINPFCNFISISPSPALPHRASAPPTFLPITFSERETGYSSTWAVSMGI